MSQNFIEQINVKNPECTEEEILQLKMLKAVFSSIADGVYFTDVNRRITAWNKAAQEITGYDSDDVEGMYCRDLLKHQDNDHKVLCDIKCPLAISMSEKRDFFGEVWLTTKDGALKPVEVHCSPVLDAKGRLLGAVEVFRDRTKQKHIEKMKEEFFSTLTHDLKTPAGSILGFADLIASPEYGEISPKKLEFIDNIKQSAEHLLSIVGNYVDASKIKEGQEKFSFENFSLNVLFEEIKQTFRPLAIKGDVNLECECSPTLWVRADTTKIRRVFHNLISNAFRYTPAGGRISIKAVQNKDRVMISVSDTGRGISDDDKKRIFSKYGQAEGEHYGTGLGLFIVKKFLEKHGSQIKVESCREKGTTFHFSLPAGKKAGIRTEKRGSILILCHDSMTQKLLRISLERDGHTISQANSAMEALQKLTLTQPNLIIIFHPLPDLSIDQLIFSFDSDPKIKATPKILVTAEPPEDSSGHFKAIVPMPLNVNKVREGINKALSD